jgi:GNAT superfamily N-acetyltransferase
MNASTPSVLLRAMRDEDLDGVLAVQAECYPPAMQEAADVVLARRRAASDTAIVACVGPDVCGYLFAYPSVHGKVTPLGGAFALPETPDTLYLHDLAVAPRALGQGVARRLVDRMHGIGGRLGLAHAALVSVQDSRRFWEGFGYAVVASNPAALASYPPGALYMARPLMTS